MENYNQDPRTISIDARTGSRSIAKNFMANVFTWMFVALGISALIAYLTTTNLELIVPVAFDLTTGKPNILGWILMLAPLGFVFAMSLGFNRMSTPVLTLLFILFAAIMGISLGFTVSFYTLSSVFGCFISAAGMFGVMAFMGYTTDKDLTTFGRILSMALIGILIAMLVNIFMKSSTMEFVISIIGVLVFTGLTAYDVQKLKRIGEGIEYEGVPTTQTRKLALMGALNLYLDFINIFLFLLRLFGGRRE